MAKKQKKKKQVGCLFLVLMIGIVALAGWFIESSLFDMLVAPDDLSPEDRQAWLDQRESERKAEREKWMQLRQQRKEADIREYRITQATRDAIRSIYVDARDIKVEIGERSGLYYSVATFLGVNAFGGPAPTKVICDWVYNEQTEEWVLVGFSD